LFWSESVQDVSEYRFPEMREDAMEPREILQATRQAIYQYAGQDPDRWFYANRFVFARLQLGSV